MQSFIEKKNINDQQSTQIQKHVNFVKKKIN
jgi:hypothetical protein